MRLAIPSLMLFTCSLAAAGEPVDPKSLKLGEQCIAITTKTKEGKEETKYEASEKWHKIKLMPVKKDASKIERVMIGDILIEAYVIPVAITIEKEDRSGIGRNRPALLLTISADSPTKVRMFNHWMGVTIKDEFQNIYKSISMSTPKRFSGRLDLEPIEIYFTFQQPVKGAKAFFLDLSADNLEVGNRMGQSFFRMTFDRDAVDEAFKKEADYPNLYPAKPDPKKK